MQYRWYFLSIFKV